MSAPLLRPDLAIIEQVYRGEQSFVVKDPKTQAYFRFRPVEVRVMRLFDGARSVADVVETLVADGLRVSTATVEGFARQLAKLGLLEATLRERTTQQLERLRSERRRKGSLVRGELFRLRFSFGDPTRLLTALGPSVRWCFTRGFIVASAVLFVAYLGVVATQGRAVGDAFAATFGPSAIGPWTACMLVLTFAALTLIHELGHAFACRHFGGEVREMGFMLLFFIPAFYANVNDAWSFPDRRARLWVTFAGPWIELAVTAVLSLLWLVVAPGSVVAQFALAAMLIGGVMNIVTNMNPLLPLDGYFALGDWLEISNLRQRARAGVASWFRRRVLRVDEAVPPADPRERRIMLWYGVGSGLYSAWVLLLLADHAIGATARGLGTLAAALLTAFVAFLLRGPLSLAVGALRTGVRAVRARVAGRGRRRKLAVVATLAVLAAAVVPCDLVTGGGFVVAPAASLVVTAPDSGVVDDVFVREGDAVAAGAPVLRVANAALVRGLVVRGRAADSLALDAARARAGARAGDGAVLADEARGADAAAEGSRARVAALRVLAVGEGVVATSRPERLRGRRVRFGDTLLVLGQLAQLDAVVRLRGGTASEVRAGQVVRLIAAANGARALTGVVDAVSLVGGGAGTLEARVRLASGAGLRPGETGEARVVVARGTLLGAAARAARTWVRSDLLL